MKWNRARLEACLKHYRLLPTLPLSITERAAERPPPFDGYPWARMLLSEEFKSELPTTFPFGLNLQLVHHVNVGTIR